MADIRIQRSHQLGLPKARKVAWQWAEDVKKRFDMKCTVTKSKTGDTVEFTRPGVNGRLLVAADHFDLEASLGFLLSVFNRRIKAEIEQILDALLAANAKAPARKAAAKKRKA